MARAGVTETLTALPDGKRISADNLALIDMLDIYTELLKYKEISGWHNMVVRLDMPRKILTEGLYSIIADDSVLCPNSFADVPRLQEAATAVVMKYAERFYRMRQERWEHSNFAYRTLDESDSNFQNYTVRIPDDEEQLIQEVQDLIEGGRIYEAEQDTLPNIHFDRHLYLPLLLAQMDGIKTEPPGLNEGEAKFVEDLRQYCKGESDGRLDGKEVFLLRNLSRGKGVGFFQARGFYPDFILWIKSDDKQRVIFVEPHGMLHSDAPDHDEKVQLHQTMRELTARLGGMLDADDVVLDSYIVSQTPYDVLSKRYGGNWDRQRFATEHIMFPERNQEYDYIERIICGDE